MEKRRAFSVSLLSVMLPRTLLVSQTFSSVAEKAQLGEHHEKQAYVQWLSFQMCSACCYYDFRRALLVNLHTFVRQLPR